MSTYTTGLLDRLLAVRGHAQNLEQLKDAVARDLEDLLNTRLALPEQLLRGYPECGASIVNYGLADFAGHCLGSSVDRDRICASIKAAIERHEPRLRNAQAHIALLPGTVNRICFTITGVLAAPRAHEPISFDAVLQPSTLHYSINRNLRGAPAWPST